MKRIKPCITNKPDTVKGLPLWYLTATVFGAGRIRPAPGTWGTLAALPFIAVPLYFADGILPLSVVAGTCAVVFFLLGIWASRRYLRVTEPDNMDQYSDPKSVVIDEACGLAIVYTTLPMVTPTLIIAGFLLFRLFDILKPWPVSLYEKNIKEQLGIMVDDVIAGTIAAIVLFLIAPFII